MQFAKPVSRREALKLGALGSAAALLPLERRALTSGNATRNRIPTSALPAPFTMPFVIPPVLQPVKRDATTDYYQLWQQQTSVEILPGKPATIFGYNGITPGPTINCQRGRPIVVQQINSLPQTHPTLGYTPWTSTHLHGSCSLPEYDGYASDVTQPGQYKNYHYPNVQDARTLWYHDHGIHHTAQNAYMGLAAQYHLHDDVEMSLGIPRGSYDVPMILKDALFAKDGSLIYEDNSESGLYGDVVLVNGTPWPSMKVERRKYRFRILNASISRSFRLQLSTGEPLTVVATDGGLMPGPQPVGDLRIGMAERYEVVIDFAKYKLGQRVVLKNLLPPNNINFPNVDKVMAFDVVAEPTSLDGNDVPSELNPNTAVMGLTEKDAVREREFVFERGGGGGGGRSGGGGGGKGGDQAAWTINGMTWKDVIDSDYKFACANPGYDDVEIWKLTNKGGGWFHPVHIHLVDFKVLDRNGKAPFDFEKGPKDVVYVGEGESVRVMMKFTNQRGYYMMHCHNLVHEDHDMMTQFCVGDHGDDPILADPARPCPAPAF
jgi:FtsP/CotA-like multicopper oxidase with cupredoxin domain